MKVADYRKFLIYITLLIAIAGCMNKYRHDSDFDDHFENYPSGAPKKRGYWIDTEKNIMENVTYKENGKKHITCRIMTKTGAGYCRYWNEDGTLRAYTTMRDFVSTGPYTAFYPNGNVQSTGFYLNNKFEGINISYHEDTRIETLAFFKEGSQHLTKKYLTGDSTHFSLKLIVNHPDTIFNSDSLFDIEFSIPYIDTLPEMRDSFFVRHDLYFSDEINVLPLHRPRYNEYLERGWVRAPFTKKPDSRGHKDTVYYLSGFLYRKLDENKLDTLDYFGPIEIKIVD